MTENPIHDMLVRGYEMAVLENLLHDDLKCDSRNLEHECTVLVVARSYQSCDGVARNWCQGRLDRFHVMSFLDCSLCHRKTLACWKIIPV